MNDVTLHLGDCLTALKTLPAASVQTCVTSPPYFGLRDYGVDGQIGLEESPDAYVAKLVDVFREVRRVLRDDGTVWLNLGDSYAGGGGGNYGNGLNVSAHQTNPTHLGNAKRMGCKPKDLIGIPWRVAFALQADGWYLRSDIIWHKPNPMPESVRDRPTKAHEYIFLLAKNSRYYYDADAVREEPDKQTRTRAHFRGGDKYTGGNAFNNSADRHPLSTVDGESRNGRNRRTVWTVTPKPFKGAHFATFPPDLVEPCILAGSKAGDTVLDPFLGSGTTGMVALQHGRKFVGVELNPDYLEMAHKRIADAAAQLRLPLDTQEARA